MSKKRLGYTWWPKDWASSQKVQSMNIIERGIYRELIDLVMDKEGAIEVNTKLWCRLWRISDQELSSALKYLTELTAIEYHDGKIWIPSCEQRLSVTTSKRETARDNGSKGGRPKKQNPVKTQKKPSGFATETKTETKTKVFVPPTLLEVKEYFDLKGYTEEHAVKAWNYYETANWVDSRGHKVRNWKQKMQGVWLRDEGKKPEKTKMPERQVWKEMPQ